jgi:ubiquinone/menaquinone biosynthesis C-methylase UbiE
MSGGATVELHPDPFRDVDAQPDPDRMIEALESRGRTPSQVALRRRFLRFVGIRRGAAALEVGCGTGVVLRDLARLVGPRGRVVGVDPSRRLLAAAERILGERGLARRVHVEIGDGLRLPFRDARFDVTLAVTVLLHVADPLKVVGEMARVTRPGGVVAVQDQDFGTVAVTHPDRALTQRIFDGVAARVYAEPWSGRRLPGLLRDAGLEDIRLLTDVYQDTTLEPYTKSFLERRAENAVRFGIADAAAARRWLDALTALVAAGRFVFTMNFYGAAGTKPSRRRRR